MILEVKESCWWKLLEIECTYVKHKFRNNQFEARNKLNNAKCRVKNEELEAEATFLRSICSLEGSAERQKKEEICSK